MNKKGALPNWIIALILAIAIFVIVVIFITGPYQEGVTNFVEEKLIGKFAGN